LNILIDVPGGFLMFFLAKQHYAMLLLQGILFDTFVVVLVGNFPRLTKTSFFTKVLVFAERPMGSYCTFSTFS
jgi:uncharacterized SAM-binding protein YcdF (DUF218 family)